jgi:hypothetical protein
VIFRQRLVTGEARFMLRQWGRFTIYEATKPPAASGGIFLRVFHHKLDRRRLPWKASCRKERLRHALPSHLCQNGSIRKWQCTFAKCLEAGGMTAPNSIAWLCPDGFYRAAGSYIPSTPYDISQEAENSGPSILQPGQFATYLPHRLSKSEST